MCCSLAQHTARRLFPFPPVYFFLCAFQYSFIMNHIVSSTFSLGVCVCVCVFFANSNRTSGWANGHVKARVFILDIIKLIKTILMLKHWHLAKTFRYAHRNRDMCAFFHLISYSFVLACIVLTVVSDDIMFLARPKLLANLVFHLFHVASCSFSLHLFSLSFSRFIFMLLCNLF